jgi:outer membrane protein assembly factor BamB
MPSPTPNSKPAAPTPPAPAWWARPYTLTALIAIIFFLAVGLTLLAQHAKTKTADLLTAPELAALKEKLQANPQDEPLKQQIRALDLQLRRRYFYQLSLTTTGSWLLLGGLGALLLAAKLGEVKRRKQLIPRPGKEEAAQRELRAARRMRWAVAGMGGVVGIAGLALSWTSTTLLPTAGRALAAAPAASQLSTLNSQLSTNSVPPADFPSPEEMRQNWPRFHGADGSGFANLTNPPLSWDLKTGAGLLWKAPVPLPGHNSPIVWGDRVFLSGGDKTNHDVFCFHAVKGDLLWRRPVKLPPPAGSQEWEVPEMAGMAASTMAADGRRAYAIFANGDLAAFDFEGKQVWAKNLGLPQNQYGHTASLALWQGRLIVLMDQGEKEEAKARLYALDAATGELAWEKPRPVGSSWDSPIVVEAAGKPQILASAVPFAVAHSATDGTELWRLGGLSGEMTPSPIFAAGLFFVISPSDKLYAIKPDGQGDITKTHVVWSSEDNVPDICSPASNGELLFTLTTGGVLTCYDAKDGKKQWDHDFETECQASPAVAGARVYLLGAKGKVIVVEAARQFKELARSDVAEPIYASPAFAPDRLYIRTTKTLFCFAAK